MKNFTGKLESIHYIQNSRKGMENMEKSIKDIWDVVKGLTYMQLESRRKGKRVSRSNIEEILAEFSKTNERHQARNSRKSANVKQDKYKNKQTHTWVIIAKLLKTKDKEKVLPEGFITFKGPTIKLTNDPNRYDGTQKTMAQHL